MDYARVFREIAELVERAGSAAPQVVVKYLHDRFSKYSWVGIYWVEGTDLVLGPWGGPDATDHTRIPIGTGVCGAAAATGVIQVVADVSKDSRYLACFPSTRSEIVVPIFVRGTVIGEIDIDGNELNAFGPDDQQFLKKVAGLLAGVSVHST